jgi:hypothetical protein
MNDTDGPFYIRQSRVGNWDVILDSTPEDLAFPADILADIVDPNCETSVWEVASLDSADIDYLVPALIPRSASNFTEIKLRIISGWKLDNLGLKKKMTTGTSLDSVLNKKNIHYVVDIATAKAAIIFAKGLKARDAKTYSKDEVMKRFASSLQEQRLQVKNFNHELLVHLVNNKYLQSPS